MYSSVHVNQAWSWNVDCVSLFCVARSILLIVLMMYLFYDYNSALSQQFVVCTTCYLVKHDDWPIGIKTP